MGNQEQSLDRQAKSRNWVLREPGFRIRDGNQSQSQNQEPRPGQDMLEVRSGIRSQELIPESQ